MWVSNISETLTEFELLEGEEEDPFLLEEGFTGNNCARGLIVENYNALSKKTLSPIKRT